jgi:Protein of unknown function (DUF3738)
MFDNDRIEWLGGIKPLPGGQTYIAQNVPAKLMIELMYHLNRRQVSGGPAWLDTDLYDIEAKSDTPHSLDELHIMFQNFSSIASSCNSIKNRACFPPTSSSSTNRDRS